MSLTLLITYTLLCGLLIVVQCEYQAHRFKQGLPISHIGKSFIYACVCAAICLAIMYGRWKEYHYYWECAAIGVTMRLAYFDLILNTIRHKDWYYVGRGTTGSIQSKIEGKLSDTAVKILRWVFVGMWTATTLAIYKTWI